MTDEILTSKKKSIKLDTLNTFYLVFAYILLFLLWWGYLLYAKNETAFAERKELDEIQYTLRFPGQDYYRSEAYLKLENKHQRQRLMIFLEGSVFLLLMLGGLVRVRKVFRQEIDLARQQKNFLLSITHELKSPLSTIKLSLQTLDKHELDPNRRGRLIGNSLTDLERLEALVDNILFAAKIERSDPGFANEHVNISALIRSISERYSTNKKAINISCVAEPDVFMDTDVLGFSSVVINLLDNAVKYSEEKTEVTVSLKHSGEEVCLSVSDHGAGIPDEEKKRVFEKFYRLGNEETRRSKGTGLGLYIVHRFVELYHGAIEVQDNKPTGSVFVLRFPLKK